MTLRELQSLHLELVCTKLVPFALSKGYALTWGQTTRTDAEAQANAAAGSGIARSLHIDRLAIDLNLFRGGDWLQTSEDHAELGAYWKTLHPLCRWGGDFKDSKGRPKPDGNHYSLEYQGRK